jgi:hypothetical protein
LWAFLSGALRALVRLESITTMLTALGVLSGAVAYWASHTFGLL